METKRTLPSLRTFPVYVLRVFTVCLRGNFHQFHCLLSLAKKIVMLIFLSLIDDCIDDTMNFTALAKFIPANVSLVKFLSNENFHVYII